MNTEETDEYLDLAQEHVSFYETCSMDVEEGHIKAANMYALISIAASLRQIVTYFSAVQAAAPVEAEAVPA